MANYNKSFNFKNGVQVDNDNFIVNANGLVGIGTSIPTQFLDVYGTTKVTGLITATNLAITGVSTFYNDVKIGSAITFNSSTGAVRAGTFYGSAAGLTGIFAISTSGWYVNAGSLSTTSKVGIGTDLPYYSLQVGQDPLIGNGLSVDALTGNVNATGIITSGYFNGNGSSLTALNATNISSGTLDNSRLPSNINVSGIITANSFSGFGTDITTLNATNITSGTLNNSRLPSNINVSGIITANSFSGSGNNITSLNATNISSGTLDNSRLPSNINVAGIITASNITANNITANLVGIASTARSLTGTPNIQVGIVTATDINGSSINVALGGTSFSALNSGRIGIGTGLPTSELQIIKNNNTLVEIISQTNQARISIGQSVGVGKSTAVLRFGNASKTLDILNNDTGNINLYLHAGPSGIGTGKFRWIYGQTNNEIMSLDYDGTLIATGDVFLGSSGISTVTIQDNLYVNGNLNVDGTLTATINYPSIISNTNLNNTSGITTLQKLNVTANIGINTSNPSVAFDAKGSNALFGRVGINTIILSNEDLACNGFSRFGSIGIGTTALYTGDVQTGSLQVHNSSIRIFNGSLLISNQRGSGIGFGTYNQRSILDFGLVGSATSQAYFIPPTVNNTGRSTFADISGLTTVPGAIIYNETIHKHQGYGSTDGGVTFAWNNLY
jgi:hypothetical protein